MSQSLLKKIFFSFVLSILGCVFFFFRKKLLAACIGYFMAAIACFCGKQLSFDKIEYDNGVFSFQDLSLSKDESTLFRAKALSIEVHPAKAKVTASIEKPEIYLGNLEGSSSISSKDIQQFIKVIQLTDRIQVENGSLIVQEQSFEQRYPFAFQISVDQNLSYLNLNIPSLPASIFSKYLGAYESLRPYTLAAGDVEAAIKLSCSDDAEVVFLDATITGKQVVVEKSQEKLRACLAEVVFKSVYQKAQGNTLCLQDILIDKRLEGIIPSISVKDSSIFINDPQGKLLWRAENIDFFASLAQQGVPEVMTSGHIIKGSMALPFSFQGKGVFQGFDSWDLDLLNSAEIPLDLKRCKRIGLKKKGPQEFLISLDVDGIDELDLHMLQELLDPMLTNLSTIKFHKGKIKADLACCVKQGVIEYIECKDLVVKEAIIKDRQRGVLAKISSLKASAWIHEPFSSLPLLRHWELNFSPINLKHKNYQDELVVEGQVFCESNNQISTALRASLGGASIVCESNGSLEKQDIKMQLILGSNHLFSSLQKRALSRSNEIEALEKVFFDLSLYKNPETLTLQGSAALGFSRGCQDEIQFQTTTFLKDLSLNQLKSSKVHFSSKKVSANTYLLLLESFALKWFVLGDMQVEGTIDKQELNFETWAAQALYDSEDIIVDLPKKEQLHYGKFLFDFEAKRWDIFLPIKQAFCKDKKLQLPFSQVDTDVYIQGTNLFAKNLTAYCEKVAFSGQIDIDFKDPNWVDLKIYPNKMEGDVIDFLAFLSHIIDPQIVSSLPTIHGKVSGSSNNFFYLKYNLSEIHKKARIEIHVEEMEVSLSKKCSLAQGAFSLIWDIEGNFLEIKDFSSKLVVLEKEGEKLYELKLPELSCKNLTQLLFDVDLRLETQTLDLARLSGKIFFNKDSFVIQMHDQHNHLFGNQLKYFELAFDADYSIGSLETKVLLSDKYFASCLEFLKKIDLLDSKLTSLEMLPTCASWKGVTLDLSKKAFQPTYQLKIQGDDVSIFHQPSDLLRVEAFYIKDNKLEGEFSYGDFKASCQIEKSKDFWTVVSLEARSLDGYIRAYEGIINPSSINIHFGSLAWDLERFAPFIEDVASGDLLEQRSLIGSLEIKIDLPALDSSARLEGIFKGGSHSKIDTDLSFKTIKPLIFTLSTDEGLQIDQFDLHLFQQNKMQAFSSIQFEKAVVKGPKDFSIKGAKLSINPEMIHSLIKKYPTAFSSSSGEKIKISNAEFTWDNHIETQLDFLADGQALQIQGVLKEGYYWFGKESVYLQKVYYFLDQGHFNVVFGVDYEDISLDVLAKLQFKDGMDLQLSIKPLHEESCHDERTSLDVFCKYDDKEGFYIQSIEGELFGVECSFTKNPRAYAPHILLLTGHLKCHPAKLASYFKKRSLGFLKDLGSGYELSGDFFLSKKEPLSSQFRGYFKGRDFHLYDFYFKTLMSEVDLKFNQVLIHDLSLSDLSGVLKVKEIKIQKEEESWMMKIPEVVLQDFRPSFLRKSLSQEEKIKPLVIKNLHMFNIEGTLGNKESFKGRGYLDFINTFKREMHILDIPIEIIGRIGFDLGIFIPVIGKLEFEMQKGKVVLKELKNTFSEGRRSRFYLSGYKDSYIGLDGELAIDIKMKQYVLLKFTEPFTLSIRGSVSKPRYSLR